MGFIHQSHRAVILLFYQALLFQTLLQRAVESQLQPFSTKIQLGIGEHVNVRCSDFAPTHREGDLFWVKASAVLNPIQRGKCTDCIAYTLGDESDTAVSKENKLPVGNSSTLHLTVYDDDDFGNYYCKQRTGGGSADWKKLLEIQIIPQDESYTNCQRDQILASDPRKRLHNPQCNFDGSYSKVQRKDFNGDRLYWCVDKIYGVRKGHFTSNPKRLRCFKKKEAISLLAVVMIIVFVQVGFFIFDFTLFTKYDDGILKFLLQRCTKSSLEK